MAKRWILFCLCVAIFISTALWVDAQRPGLQTRGGELQSQETIDALQDRRIFDLESRMSVHDMIIVQLQADRNWLMGGLAVIGGMAVIVQIVIELRRRKP